jgi:hypothetical protein
MYSKSTQTDIVILNDSCHPHEHKIASINYLVNRLNIYLTSKQAKEKELHIYKNTLHNNNYNINKVKNIKPIKQNTDIDPRHRKTNWSTFTYSGKETRDIAELFKDTQIKTECRTRNTTQNIIKQHPRRDKCNKNGIYQMKCLDCPLK